MVLIIFADKERDIELATLAIRRDLEQAQARETALKGDIRQLQQQLADAKNGLLAAARISDQLEIAQVTVASLREECKCMIFLLQTFVVFFHSVFVFLFVYLK